MTRTEAKAFHADMINAVNDVLKKYNVIRKSSNLTFGETESKLTITVGELTSTGEVKVDADKDFIARYALDMPRNKGKLPKTIIGATAQVRNLGEVTIIDFSTKAHKYPFIVKVKSSGVVYKVPADSISF